MTRRAHLLIALLVALVVGKLGAEAYDWAAHREERDLIQELRGRLGDAGVEVMRVHARADTLRAALREADAALEREKRALDAYGEESTDGMLPRHLYAAYRGDLARYNRQVQERNRRVRELTKLREREQAALDRYHAVGDSIRAAARLLGDPYYHVPSPAEAAEARGVVLDRR